MSVKFITFSLHSKNSRLKMSSWLLLILFIHQVQSTAIGRISNVSLRLVIPSSSIITNITSQECLCKMVASSNVSALNYFSNDTCEFFSNVSLTHAAFSWIVNTESVFYFLQLPTRPNSPACNTGNESTIFNYRLSADIRRQQTNSFSFWLLFLLVSSPLVGTTIFGNENGRAGNSLSELSFPWSVTVNSDDSLLITDTLNFRVLRVPANSRTGVVVPSGVSFLPCRRAYFDDSLLNLFVIDTVFCQMKQYYNNSQTFTRPFGTSCGASLTRFQMLASFCMDSMGNFYVVDTGNHRIMFWPVNSTTGVLVAGTTSVSGNDSSRLYYPQDIALDEDNRLIYVADTFNNRIIRYALGNPNGTVVAGGNGPGTAPK